MGIILCKKKERIIQQILHLLRLFMNILEPLTANLTKPSQIMHLPSQIMHLPSQKMHLPSQIMHLP